MSKIPTVIELFYDVVSPYSFLAFEVLCRYQSKWNINLKLKPFLLGGVMKLSGNKAPLTVPNKGVYMSEDMKRLQKYFQVPVFLPPNMMELIMDGSLKAQRFIVAVDTLNPKYTENISRALWLRLYDLHKDINQAESLREAGKSIGMNEKVIEDAIAKISEQSIKDKLQLNTKQAMDYGAFGAPMIVAHVNNKPEVFFGSDRFELLAYVIGEKWEGPMPTTSKL